MAFSISLPDGWTSEPCYGRDAEVITSPSHVFVTVDWSNRGFRSGITTIGTLMGAKKYTGRGWRQQLVDDAVSWLSSLGHSGATP